jgi:hypothetical protein
MFLDVDEHEKSRSFEDWPGWVRPYPPGDRTLIHFQNLTRFTSPYIFLHQLPLLDKMRGSDNQDQGVITAEQTTNIKTSIATKDPNDSVRCLDHFANASFFLYTSTNIWCVLYNDEQPFTKCKCFGVNGSKRLAPI